MTRWNCCLVLLEFVVDSEPLNLFHSAAAHAWPPSELGRTVLLVKGRVSNDIMHMLVDAFLDRWECQDTDPRRSNRDAEF